MHSKRNTKIAYQLCTTPDLGERLDAACTRLAARQAPVDLEHLGELPTDREQRVQRALRILEHIGVNLLPAPHAFGPEVDQRLPAVCALHAVHSATC